MPINEDKRLGDMTPGELFDWLLWRALAIWLIVHVGQWLH